MFGSGLRHRPDECYGSSTEKEAHLGPDNLIWIPSDICTVHAKHPVMKHGTYGRRITRITSYLINQINSHAPWITVYDS